MFVLWYYFKTVIYSVITRVCEGETNIPNVFDWRCQMYRKMNVRVSSSGENFRLGVQIWEAKQVLSLPSHFLSDHPILILHIALIATWHFLVYLFLFFIAFCLHQSINCDSRNLVFVVHFSIFGIGNADWWGHCGKQCGISSEN